MSQAIPAESDNSLWTQTAVAGPDCDRLQESMTVDVLVVGAGFTGLSCALHLAEQGVSVAVLEARSIGFGGSGRNAGLVNAGVWQTPDHVSRVLGSEAGQRFNQVLCDSPQKVFDLIARYQIDCEAQQCGTVNIAHKASALKYLEQRCRQIQGLGSDVRLIDEAESQRISGSGYYRFGGIHDPNAGTIQPLSYVRGLAKAALSQGVVIYENSPLVSLQQQETRWQAVTPEGQVMADQVIMATNAYADRHCLGTRESTIPVFIFHCATGVLPDAIQNRLIPERQGLWDTQTLLTSSRIDGQGRLVMSSAGSLYGPQGGVRQNWMQRMRDRLYPETCGIPWESHWTGQIGVTSSKILRVQRLAPGVFAPAGYNGRGIGTGTVIGLELAQLLLQNRESDFPFPIENAYREPLRKTRGAYYQWGTLALQMTGNRI